MKTAPATDQLQSDKLFVKMAISAWQTYNDRVTKLVEKLSDEALAGEVAPGKNTGTYLFGHLIAVNDNLFPLFGFGENLYPELGKIFLDTPDKSGLKFPAIPELKKYWQNVNRKLTDHFTGMTPEDWLSKHNSVSAEDFAKEPHRNKLNVILNRTSHQSYHLGQMTLLEKR
jgi:uncharacterized damage-inducible protein DinB